MREYVSRKLGARQLPYRVIEELDIDGATVLRVEPDFECQPIGEGKIEIFLDNTPPGKQICAEMQGEVTPAVRNAIKEQIAELQK